jgi:hypothetical protein
MSLALHVWHRVRCTTSCGLCITNQPAVIPKRLSHRGLAPRPHAAGRALRGGRRRRAAVGHDEGDAGLLHLGAEPVGGLGAQDEAHVEAGPGGCITWVRCGWRLCVRVAGRGDVRQKQALVSAFTSGKTKGGSPALRQLVRHQQRRWLPQLEVKGEGAAVVAAGGGRQLAQRLDVVWWCLMFDSESK